MDLMKLAYLTVCNPVTVRCCVCGRDAVDWCMGMVGNRWGYAWMYWDEGRKESHKFCRECVKPVLVACRLAGVPVRGKTWAKT